MYENHPVERAIFKAFGDRLDVNQHAAILFQMEDGWTRYSPATSANKTLSAYEMLCKCGLMKFIGRVIADCSSKPSIAIPCEWTGDYRGWKEGDDWKLPLLAPLIKEGAIVAHTELLGLEIRAEFVALTESGEKCRDLLRGGDISAVSMFRSTIHNPRYCSVTLISDAFLGQEIQKHGSLHDSDSKMTAHPTAHQQVDDGAPIRENGSNQKKKKVFDRHCETLLRRWVKAMEASREWIPRIAFISNELLVLQKESPNTWNASWKPRRFNDKFKDNPEQWTKAVEKWSQDP